VLLSAHFDSWDGASGATDNGTGTLVMMEAMRILKLVLPHPTRKIIVGHWTSEENGLVGSRAFTEDHPEVLAGLQALFNQDNGTGRVVRIGAAGLPDAGAKLKAWFERIPEVYRRQITLSNPGFPSGGGSDDASFACHGLPAFGLGALNWQYGNYTWHTNRDSYDKVVFDDLRSNATLTAMLVYLASEESGTIARDRVDLVALAEAAKSDTTTGRRPIPTSWPECSLAPRVTKPRVK
jgi:Zn-dependent M28 family amino/carboxypeptidase